MPNFNAENNLSEYMNELGRLARKSYSELRIADSSTKNYALKKMAEEIRKKEKQILLANDLDISRAEISLFQVLFWIGLSSIVLE